MKKMACDRCGLELTERWDILMALEGKKAWQRAARARGIEPRGVLPCMNYIRCGGQIRPVNKDKPDWWQRLRIKK